MLVDGNSAVDAFVASAYAAVLLVVLGGIVATVLPKKINSAPIVVPVEFVVVVFPVFLAAVLKVTFLCR